MEPKRREQIEEILNSHLETPTGESGGSLRQLFDRDQELLHDVETLLAEATGTEPFAKAQPRDADTLEPGTRIGPYRIDGVLGRGGMGVVHLATRADDFEQRVALKLIASGLETAEILDRFYKERQILATLEHPNIARLLDGGSTAQALPYFAMEYVDGERIDHYCEQHGLSVSERLELFRKVCAAVHFAHQNLVVHRDLKPGNILVTPDGEPKLLDFGIAKILEGGLSHDAQGGFATLPDNRPMTPDYASPEQVLGQPITTVSDIYSLGVLLYRLVSGQPPYRLGGCGAEEILVQVCSREPPPPSAAAHRRLRRRLRGDVDAIVAKAMRKEPEERYGSAAQLADDIDRHLRGLPVAAHRGSWLYRTRKFARRHKLSLVILGLIVAFAIASTFLWRRAVDERQRAEAAARLAEIEKARAVEERAAAERQRQRAEEVSGFLEALFESADPNAARGDSVAVREILDQGRRRLARDLRGEPEILADLAGTLGTVYNNLGLYDDARELKEEALRLRRAAGSPERTELAIDLNNLARFYYDLGDYPRAEPLVREALSIWRRLGDDDATATTLLNLAAILNHRGERDEALALHAEILEIRRGLYGEDDPKVASSLYSLGFLHYTRGESERAEPLLRQALAIYSEAYGGEHTRVASVANTLGLVLHARGRLAEARDTLERALELRLQLLGPEHVHSANTRKNLAAVLLDQGETEAAGELLEAALEVLRKEKPEGDWTLADAESVWGAYLATRGRAKEAEAVLLESWETLRRIKGEDDVFTQNARRRVEDFYEAQGRGDP